MYWANVPRLGCGRDIITKGTGKFPGLVSGVYLGPRKMLLYKHFWTELLNDNLILICILFLIPSYHPLSVYWNTLKDCRNKAN